MRRIILRGPEQRDRAIEAVSAAAVGLEPPLCVEIKEFEEDRTLEQNAAQWPILEAFARQKRWVVNGERCYMTSDEWKDVLTAAFRRETARMAQAIGGGNVMLGLRTSKMKKREFSEWLDFLHATAAQLGVEVEAHHAA